MSESVDHTALPFDESIERLMFPGDLPKDGRRVCRIMQDGWEIGIWIETDREGAGPVARKILAVNDLLEACKVAVVTLGLQDIARQTAIGTDCTVDSKPTAQYAIDLLVAAITKAENTPFEVVRRVALVGHADGSRTIMEVSSALLAAIDKEC